MGQEVNKGENMVNCEYSNGTILIKLFGAISSVNSNEIETNIFEFCKDKDINKINIDCSELEYISSSGLRIILKLRKMCSNLNICEVNNDVYNVFEMTGFSELMKVSKAFRKLSVEGCPILGEGSNGIVYRYDPETVIKVYRNPDALDEINRAQVLAKRALILDIPTAIPFDVVRVGDKYGSVFELLNAVSFSQIIKEDYNNKDKYIKIFADLLKQMHNTDVSHENLDDIKHFIVEVVSFLKPHLPKEDFEKLTYLVQNVPERKTMIHGDYHTNNLVMNKDEPLIIDMDTLSFGHPIFELGPIYSAFVGFGAVFQEDSAHFLGLDYVASTYIWTKFLEYYLGTEDKKKIYEVENKAMIIAYSRILRRTIKRIGFDNPKGAAVINYCKKILHELLPYVDTLDF